MTSVFDPETKIWKGPTLPLPDVGNITLGEMILEKLSETPDRVFQIMASDGEPFTCRELKAQSIRVAQNLAKINVKPDDVVGIIVPQSHFATSLIIGCIISGVVVNPLHEALSDNDISSVFSQTKPKVIVCEEAFIPRLKRALANSNFHHRIYSTATKDTLSLRASNLIKPTGIEEHFVPPKFKKSAEEKLFAILCSSGTTGTPKGVCISHLKMTSSLPLISMYTPTGEVQSYCSSPIYWATGFYQNLIPIFTPNETRIVPSAKAFSTEGFLELVQKHRLTYVIITPGQLNSILNYENLSAYDLSSLKRITSGGAVISKRIRDKYSSTFPDKELQIPYGMTESSGTMQKPGEYKLEYCAGSVILPNNQIKIVDDAGSRLGIGERGEICIKSAHQFEGYYNNPEATSKAVDDEGFFVSGDIGYFNDEGMLFVVDRKKDVLKCKSMQVNLSEVESVIQSIEGVDAASVVGIPDDIHNNLLTAAIVKRSGYEKLSEKNVIDYVASSVPDHKQLHGGVYFFDKLPMTPTGKVQKRFVLEKILKLRKT